MVEFRSVRLKDQVFRSKNGDPIVLLQMKGREEILEFIRKASFVTLLEWLSVWGLCWWIDPDHQSTRSVAKLVFVVVYFFRIIQPIDNLRGWIV